MHSAGFEPATFQRKTDYESGAFNHSATNARKFNLELMGIEPTSIQQFLIYSFTDIVSMNKFSNKDYSKLEKLECLVLVKKILIIIN